MGAFTLIAQCTALVVLIVLSLNLAGYLEVIVTCSGQSSAANKRLPKTSMIICLAQGSTGVPQRLHDAL